MTIPRVIFAAALAVLGFMIWGIHKDIWTLTANINSAGTVIVSKIDAVAGQMTSAHSKLDVVKDKVMAFKTGKATIGKPRVPPVKNLPKQEPNFWDKLFK